MTGHGTTVDSADESGTVELEDGEVDTTLASRATVYGLFVRLFDEPDEQVYEAIDDGSLSQELATLVERADLEIDSPQLETDDDLRTLKARFNDIFEVGVPMPSVPLYESSHRDDVSWHDLNLDLARAYDYYGLDVDDSNREDHDNLRLQLEFASYLARREAVGDPDARAARRDFLDRHLTVFARQLSDAIESEPNTGVYGELADFLEAFVAAEHRSLASTDQ
ncbi:molecular chaperone TorD family protein [Halalkaliarchaeum sp. AArc-GB]|uniref:molecular chaperone TorD family protein n=1 Tax=Halalkaliarchaeum sp. AArc-GB TaxID=3074078 RepID=UPI00285A2667|nr:molecular chaperone TorD family protein [Halalkaliarchaeum sp. AArc-GB]MDR5674089.1 molecular chaperone TorD family protein [Halalkaliarchaeum sp. AArc-GB]